MMEGESNVGREDWRPLALPVAILVAALVVSATMLYSANAVTGDISSLKAALLAAKVNPGTNQIVAPTPTPAGGTGGNTQIDTSGRPFKGAADAPITIVEFSDFQCPFCSRAEPTITQLMADYPGKIKVVFMNFPLSFHANAQKAAEAYECAADQGKAYEMHGKMFANQDALTVSDLKQYAVDLGLNTETFNACLDNGAKASIVAAQTNVGTDAGVEGTPTFFINGKKIVGAQPIATFKTEIDRILGAG